MSRLKLSGILSFVSSLLLSIFSNIGTVWADARYNLPEPVSPATREIFDLHMLTTWVSVGIMVVVIAIMTFIIFSYRKSEGAKADLNFHKNAFGVWGWIAVPVIVLGIDMSIAGPGKHALKLIESHKPAELTVKITGSQWKWTYDYMDYDFGFVSNLSDEDPTSPGYLREVDNRVVLPTGKRIRLLHTSSDVLHNWWVPSIAFKKDAIPGYILETWTEIEKEGVYYGQCAEICGGRHAYMPIVVEAVSPEKFEQWVAEKQGKKIEREAEANSDKVWEKEELMAKGEAIYKTNCAACHQPNGEGIPGVFPAIKGGTISTGSLDDHLNIVMKGKPGTAMTAWAKQLNDLDIAAVITYERNAWGNNTGDIVQPTDIRKKR